MRNDVVERLQGMIYEILEMDISEDSKEEMVSSIHNKLLTMI